MRINKKLFSDIGMWILIILSVVLIIDIIQYIIRYYYINEILISPPTNHSSDYFAFDKLEPNEIGDSIGGILGPIIGLCATLLTFLAFYMQKRANDIVSKQFAEQKTIDYRQNFENTFFNLLTIHHQIIDSIDFKTSKIYYLEPELKTYIESNRFYKQEFTHELIIEEHLKSRDVFKFTLTILNTILEDELFIEKIYGSYNNATLVQLAEDFSKLKLKKNIIKYENETIYSYFSSLFNIIYSNVNTDYGHYFRNLYRIIKIVDEQIFDKDDEVNNYKIKYSYTSIIRAQLSDDEAKWIFFNCLSKNGYEKFKPLIEKYSLLKIISIPIDPIPIDSEEDEPYTYTYYSKLYNATAFKNPTTYEEIKAHLHIDFYKKNYSFI
jgi:hypothetical protein